MMANMMSYREPNRFDIIPVTITVNQGLIKPSIRWEVRDFIQLYHILSKRNHKTKCEDIKILLSEVARLFGYADFDIEKRVSMKSIGLADDV